ncbi:PP2C family protein-serine/threonine phosphatase [Streptomyces sp. NPDC003077]|uniref:PP2C family protein-serine/threonine phosphatase n=1 Tax=Streptomyces sp. NPDC003077 TaxID=3154443 RepID=UPI0033B2E4DF
MRRRGGGRTGEGEQAYWARWAPFGRRVARWLPVLLLAGGVAFEFGMPAGSSAAPFLSAAPLVAAPLHSPRVTAVTAVVAVGCATWAAVLHGDGQSAGESSTEVVTVLVVAVLALGINWLVRRTDDRLASVRDVAEAAQRAVLPTPGRRVGGLMVAARYVAARADARIGGDLYAVQDTRHGVRLVVGDVRGKGLDAVEAAVIVVGAFREAAEQEASLEAVAGRLERALQREGRRREGLDQFEGFTTAVLAEIPSDEHGTLRVLNRGHPAPLLISPTGGLCEVEPAVPALPLGMSEVAGWPDRADETEFPAGSTLLLFTDGVTEARNEKGEFYEPETRLRGRCSPDPEVLLETLVADVARHAGGGPADDMALLAVRRPGEGEG